MLNNLNSYLLPASMAIGFSTDTVRVIVHKRLTIFLAFSVRIYVGIYCLGETVDLAIDRLNKALGEFYNWCPNNRLTPHPRKSEVILFTKRTPMGSTTTVYLGNSVLGLVTKTKLWGLKLTWVANVLETKTWKAWPKNWICLNALTLYQEEL